MIREEAARARVDPNLMRAIMYVENAQGHYLGAARAAEGLGLAKSILPMNIRPNFWSALGFTERDFYNPRTNIRAGALLLKRIHERLDHPTVSKLATLYNSLPRNSVSDFGARVADVYHSRAWDRFRDR
jgi:soluble lytic murein transglycosylase-like protein